MSGKRTAFVTAGLAAGVVTGGVVARTVLRRRRPDPEAEEPLSLEPPEDLGFVESFDGTRIAVRAAGDPSAPILLFVHGFSLDMTIWHYQWTALSDRFRCVLFDLRSHGRSGPAASGDLSLAAMGHDVAAVLEAVVPGGRAVLVGHSLGGMAILSMAESRPDLFGERVAGAALFGSSASDLLRDALGSVAGVLRPDLRTLRGAVRGLNRLRSYVLASPTDLGKVVVRVTQFGPDASPHLVGYVVGLAARAPSAVWTDGLVGLMDADLRHVARHVRVPVLVAIGEHDRVTPPGSAAALADRLPDGRLEIIEGAGHMAMLERHETVNEMLAAFAAGIAPHTAEVRPARRANARRRPA